MERKGLIAFVDAIIFLVTLQRAPIAIKKKRKGGSRDKRSMVLNIGITQPNVCRA